jgi:hypothetical protein
LGISDLEIRKGKRLFSLFRANLSVLRVIALLPGLRRAFLSGPPFFSATFQDVYWEGFFWAGFFIPHSAFE